MSDVIRIHAEDTVAVALRDLAAGETVTIEGRRVQVSQPIPLGHKLALAAHAPGTLVRKYGAAIGLTRTAITEGEHVHLHNLRTALGGEHVYTHGGVRAARSPAGSTRTWRGYARENGRAASRNEIWILPTVGCVGLTAEQAAREAALRHASRVDGIYAFAHPHGCSQLGDDLSGTRAVLAGLAANPNAAGVLILGLGCESNQLDALMDRIDPSVRGRIRTLVSQTAGDELSQAAALIDELADAAAAAVRTELPLSRLRVGLKCGGSDGLSGLTANPLLGRFADAMAAAEAGVVLTEIPEIFGAEQALLQRATSPAVFDAAGDLINRFKRYYLDQGLPVSENPSPGNQAGGITTLEEKSLGAVQKGGQAPLTAVIDYGEAATTTGLTLLEAPGNDAVSSTALAAAGCTMVLFTTGRGTPLGAPVPTLKVASNAELAAAKPHWIDFDASLALREGADAADAAFFDTVVDVASGRPCAAERNAQRGLAIWKRGVTL